MKNYLVLSIAALALVAPAAQAEVTKTRTVETPKGTGTKTVTRDHGNLESDTVITRASDGATATKSRDRVITENGVSGSGSSSGFNGRTGSYQYDRTRTGNGWETNGSGTGRGGASYDYYGQGQKTETGREASRTLNRNGTQVYQRSDSVSRANGQVTHDRSVTRTQGFKPRKAGRRL